MTGWSGRSPGFEKGSSAVALANPGVRFGGDDNAKRTPRSSRTLPFPACGSARQSWQARRLLLRFDYPSWRVFSLRLPAVGGWHELRPLLLFAFSSSDISSPKRDMLADLERVEGAPVDLVSRPLPGRRPISTGLSGASFSPSTRSGTLCDPSLRNRGLGISWQPGIKAAAECWGNKSWVRSSPEHRGCRSRRRTEGKMELCRFAG